VASTVSVGATPPPAPRKRRSRGAPGRPRLIAFLYIAPAILFFATFVVFPVASTVNASFYQWNGITQATWVGLDNYIDIINDEKLIGSFRNSLVFVFFFSLLPVSLGLLIAAVMGRHPLKGLTVFRVILFVPQVVALIVSALAWRWMYATEGAVNQILTAIGLGDITRAWLGDFTWALPAVGFIGTWIMVGLTMILFLSGIQKIDPSLYEAARMDGAGPIQEFFAVTLPGLRGEVAVALSITMIAALKTFDVVFATTGGGPGSATLVPAIAVFRLAFRESQVGAASAVAVVLAIIVGLIVFLINRFVRKPE
jgi:raffinose/stachyose/melibiose transport system permease protein